MTTRRALAHSPVVVVGAGPVGLTVALGLAAHQIPTLVLESRPTDVSMEWRGSTIHPPTLEILDRMGLAANALAGGVRVDRIQYRDLVLDDVVEMDLSVLAADTRFPFRLQYDQYKLLGDLRNAARDDPHIDVRYEHCVVGIEPGDERQWAAVVVRTPADMQRLGTRAVVAADGSHSTVRDALGVALAGETYETSSLVVASDFAFDTAIPGLAPVSYWTGPRGRMSLIRTPDTWRIALTTSEPSSRSGNDGATLADEVHPEFVDAMAHVIGEREWRDLRQHQLYRSHQRVAETFNVGRVVLVGDAAHLSATTGGMGLNSGIHDAHVVVAAMARAILAGHAEETAVAAVAAGRRRVALDTVQPATSAARVALDCTDASARRERLNELRRITADADRLRNYLVSASMLDAVDL